MYFFYIDESGTRDPTITKQQQDGTIKEKEYLYILTAVSLFEYNWAKFERTISNLKLELSDYLFRRKKMKFDLAACEVKSTWLRNQKQRKQESPFLDELSEDDRKKLSELFYHQLTACKMNLFSVVIDKRKLRDHIDQQQLHKKAYELLLERIENFLGEYHNKHQGVIVMDDTDKTINRALSMKHAYFQREGNQSLKFRHIVEYPFFTNSALSNGVQLADLCGYNVYRAFRYNDFKYPYLVKQLPHFYSSKRTGPLKLDGLKVFPDDSDLVEFARQGWITYKTEQPTLWGGL